MNETNASRKKNVMVAEAAVAVWSPTPTPCSTALVASMSSSREVWENAVECKYVYTLLMQLKKPCATSHALFSR